MKPASLTPLLLLILLTVAGKINAQENPPKVTLPNTQLLTLNSSIVGQEYALHIQLPGNYNDSSKTFPVVYLLDGQWDFPLLCALYGQQYFDGFIPALIVVGITWGGKNPNPDLLRARDFTPTAPTQTQQAGNAPKFLQFIKQELIPFIDSKFRTNKNDRTLIGSSLGGLFTLYAMFNETAVFNRYVLTSPAVGWDNEVIYNSEKKYAATESNIPIRLSMAIGALEKPELYNKLVEHLKAQHYKGLEMQSRSIENTGHSGGKAEGYARGLQFVFAKPALSLATALLDQYTGAYQLNPQITFTVTREGNHLILTAPGNTNFELQAESEKDFYVKGIFLNIHFKKDTSGKVTGCQFDQFGGSALAAKIK